MGDQFFHSNVPVVPGNQIYLERPQIYQILEKAVQCPVVTVVAGAGYGKTYAVYSFLRNYNVVTSWMQFSERDNDPNRFWENFTGTVGTISQEGAKRIAEVGFPRTERQYDRYFAVPQMELLPGVKYIFVYDDFNLLHNPAVLRFLERAITTPFRNITSIVISRTELPFNLLGLLSKGLLAQITQDELRFTREEAGRYFSLLGIRLPSKEAAEIYRDTEGWALAIHLVGVLLQKVKPGDYGRTVVLSNIFKLIEGEIFSGLSQRQQEFLIKLSLIEKLPRELILNIAGDKALVGEMERIGTFISFDAYINEYRIHHLLLEYLRGKQGTLPEEEKRRVYNLAACWCADHGFKIDAFNYYEKAVNYEAILKLVYNTLPLVMPDAIAEFLLEIFQRAPEEFFEHNATAVVVHSRLLTTLGRFDEAESLLWSVIEKYECQPPTPFKGSLFYRCYNNLGFIRLITGVFTHRYGFAFYFEKGASYHALSDYRTTGPTSVMTVGSCVCRVGSAEKGKMEEFVDAMNAAIPFMVITLNGCAYGYDDLARGELAYFRTDLEKAEQFCSRAQRKAQSKDQYEIENRALFYLLRISLARGEAEKAEALLKQMEARLEDPVYVNRYTFHDINRGWFYAHLGIVEKMPPWLKDDFEESDLSSLSHGLETLVKVKGQLAEKRYSAALATLESIRVSSSGVSAFLLGRIGRTVLEAICRYRDGDQAGAFKALRDAWELAEPNGFDMSFIEMGRDMRALAGAALKEQDCPVPRPWLEKIQRNAAAYGKKFFTVVEYFRGGGKGAEGEALSRREMEVLSALAQGLTREEIAAESGISVNTVKSALRGAYNKLGALNRADAVRIATARGLLKNL